MTAPIRTGEDGRAVIHIFGQVGRAEEELERDESALFHFPWPSLDGLVGGMLPGDVGYVGGFSGHGKTTFLTSLVVDLYMAGRKVYYMGLESAPWVLRTHLACKLVGYDAGDILTKAYRKWPNADAIKLEIRTAIREMAFSMDGGELLRCCPVPEVNEDELTRAMHEAAAFGADVFIVDHVDHLQAEGVSEFSESMRVNRALLREATETGIKVIAATQFNNDAVRGNPVGLHVAPRPHYVQWGGHKRQKAAWMLGLYRPLLLAGVPKETIKAYKAGLVGQAAVCEPNTMGVYCMKHRHIGRHEGERVFLSVDCGRVRDIGQAAYSGALHGIRTNGSII